MPPKAQDMHQTHYSKNEENNTQSLFETALGVNHMNSPDGRAQLQQLVMKRFSRISQWDVFFWLCYDLVIKVMFYCCPVELKSSTGLDIEHLLYALTPNIH